MKLKKGDTVSVLAGKDRGKKGKILRLDPNRGTALVEQINLAKHFERRTRQDQPGGIIQREVPIAVAKLALVCPRCSKPTRVGIQETQGARQRVCKRCQEVVGG